MCRVSLAFAVLLVVPACVDLSHPLAPPDGGVDGPAPPDGLGEVDAGDDVESVLPPDAPVDELPPPPDAGDEVSPPEGGQPDLPAPDLSRGLVGYWKLDDRVSMKVEDSSGNGNDGTALGLPALLVGSVFLPPIQFPDPGAFAFTLMNDAIVVPDPPDMPALLRPAQISVSVWVKLASQSARGTNCGSADANLQYILHRRNMRGSEGRFEGVALMKEPTGNFAFLLGTNAGQQEAARSITLANTTSWFHLVGTFDGRVIQLYVNGSLEGLQTHVAPIDYDPLRPLYIARTGECAPSGEGDATWDARLNGALDDVRIYDRVLTVDEVSRLASGRN